MDIEDLIKQCTETAKEKGFDLNMHATQIGLMATEVAEALEFVTPSGNGVTDTYLQTLRTACLSFENYRKYGARNNYVDSSTVIDKRRMYRDLADMVIRAFSYAGGNGDTEMFIEELLNIIEENKHRLPLHGKGF